MSEARPLFGVTAEELDELPAGWRIVETVPAEEDEPDCYTITKQATGKWEFDDGGGYTSGEELLRRVYVPNRQLFPPLAAS